MSRPASYRIRGLKDTGLTNLPLHSFSKNQIWVELAQLAYELNRPGFDAGSDLTEGWGHASTEEVSERVA